MGIDLITLDDFKAYFKRGFIYASGENCSPSDITDHDLEKAKAEAEYNFNEGLFSTQEELEVPFYYIWAHYLVMDVRQGLAGLGTSASFPVSSKSVDAVSQSYSIPDWVLNDPNNSFFASTYYGMKYLSLIRPYTLGTMRTAYGRSTSR